jgi:hypothetical protein
MVLPSDTFCPVSMAGMTKCSDLSQTSTCELQHTEDIRLGNECEIKKAGSVGFKNVGFHYEDKT